MTVFKQTKEKPVDQPAWFKFQDSRIDKVVSDQMEAMQKAAAAEKRDMTADELEEFEKLAAKVIIFEAPEEGAAEFQVRRGVGFYAEKAKNRKKRNEFILNPTTRAMERVSYYPDLTPAEQEKETEDLYDYVITGVKWATWDSGEEIKCTRENKLKLMKDEKVSRFIRHCINTLVEAEKTEAEAAEKN